MTDLSPEVLAKAKKELNENPDRRMKDIQVLRDMVLANPSLKCPTDDEFLLRFLRARKFNYDRAYNMVIEYYTIRAENKSTFEACVPSKLGPIMARQVSMILPHRDKQGRRILFFRPARWDHTKFPMMDILRLNVVQLEKIIREPETQVHGMVLVGDLSGLTMAHVKHMDRDYGRLMSAMMQDAFPMRLKELHICKEPAVFTYAWAMFKPFLKDKMSKRVYFNGTDLSRLHESCGVESLPQEVGGALGPADDLAEAWYNKLRENEAMYQEMLTHKIELSRAITKKKNEEVVDSLIGTYKKLSVD